MTSREPTRSRRQSFDDDLATEKVPDLFVDTRVEEIIEIGEEDVWASKLLNQGETLAAAGRLFEAIEMIGLVITLEPRNDVARARLHDLTARLVARSEARSVDDTVQLGF
ncbi:MAG: hypothetical protein JRH11_21415 [Deltaproteobacteria bacterium]|nr:hypothetical protein [Deltaproteobacteria bacterium]